MIIWLTGQPGSGKTVLAGWLRSISSLNNRVEVIDGDDIREIFQNKDYSETGRRRNIELAQNLALFLHKKKFNVIVSLVSPYRDQRESFKELLGNDLNFSPRSFNFKRHCFAHCVTRESKAYPKHSTG
jgi:adenylylsulfate kinase